MSYSIVRYTPKLLCIWDEIVKNARQSSFLHFRNYMEYHSKRFQDFSLVVYDKKNRPVAILPACIDPVCEKKVESHAGLTYGGLLYDNQVTTVQVGEILRQCILFYQQEGFGEFGYKPMPYIYHKYPAEEDLYWLVRYGARIDSRSVSSVIDLRKPLSFSSLRKRKIRKSDTKYPWIFSDSIDELPLFWELLDKVLITRHSTHPVHSLEELHLLISRFPQQIQLRVIKANSESAILAGCLLYVTPKVVHVQYIAASDEGCQQNALDVLFSKLLMEFQADSEQIPYFDFGISTENKGTVLNEGLIFQKEGFGARAVCYDSYTLSLCNTINCI